MQINNLKYRLLDKLISIQDINLQDINLLEKVNDLIGNVDINKSVFKITPDQKKMLIESEEDILNEDFITDAELNEEEDKWLKS